jgi:hypothetical protein
MSPRTGPIFELVVQDLVSADGETGRTAPLSVPPGVSSLRLTADGPRLAARDDFEPDADPFAALVEPVRERNRQPALLFVPPGDGGALVNGLACPAVALLSPLDQVQLGDFVLHVAVFTRPAIGPVPAEFVGKKSCPICRTRFAAGQHVYLCSNCGSTALHIVEPAGNGNQAAAPDDGSAMLESEVLDCVRLVSTCPSCLAPVVLSEGYSHYPTLEL